jgi:DNA ligase 1
MKLLNQFKPMLASPAELDKINFPVFSSLKLDGIRAMVVEGSLLSRTLKPIPNKHVREFLSNPLLNSLDGELLAGPLTAENCYRVSASSFMTQEEPPTTDWKFYVFDDFSTPNVDFKSRYQTLQLRVKQLPSDLRDKIKIVNQKLLYSSEEVIEQLDKVVTDGHEGLMLRSLIGPYKFGRATAREGFLLKVKKFQDSECKILEIIEAFENQNELETDERGYAKRSTKQANLIPKGTMGSLLVRDLHTSVEFNIGTGFDDQDREWFWINRQNHKLISNLILKYKFFPGGVKDKPRFPAYLGLRWIEDL